MKHLTALFSLLAGIFLCAQAQHSHQHQREMAFPDIPGYLTLKCDFHIHTVFSDGSVWPDIRIQEALKDGLDAVSMTEHLEYQPHAEDIPHPDRNRSFAVASQAAQGQELLVVNGSEITRDMPPGHANAIFIQDANKLLIDDPVAVFREAKRQGAFTFWNHPNWTRQRSDGIARLDDMHRQLINEGLLHGIEVINDLTYSAEALQIALDHNLTIMATSDIHGLVDWQYDIALGGHRPLTLVFATEKTPEAIKDALLNRRTVGFFHNLLVGRDAYLQPLLKACFQITRAQYLDETSVLEVEIKNNSSADMSLQNLMPYSLHAHSDLIEVPHHGSTTLQIKTRDKLDALQLHFRVLNAVTAPKTHPELKLPVKVGG